MKTLYLAGGCFWGVQKYLDQFPGIIETQAGYANGGTEAPSYEEVCQGAGHAETVKVVYDEEVLPTEKLLGCYFDVIDPLSVNKQGPDVGVQYRTGIYYDAEAAADAAFLAEIARVFDRAAQEAGQPLATECGPLENYYPAEEYHQKYLDKNPGGYCHIPREKMHIIDNERRAYEKEHPALDILCLLPMNEERTKRLEEAAAEGVRQREALGDATGLPPKWQPKIRYKLVKDLAADDMFDAKVIIGNAPVDFYKAGFAPELIWIQGAMAGTDHMVRPGVLADDVILTSAVGAYGLSVSEHMVAQTMDLVRHFHLYRDNQREHIFKAAGPIISVEGARILILGMGDIGTDYARKVKGIGAYTIGVRKNDKPKPEAFDEQHLMDELDELLPTADIVAMVLPGGPETKKIMDERRLRLMKKGAYLLNVGRGTSIDQDALKKVLKEGHLGGAALDVMVPEPLPADDELWDMPNVVLTPHIAGDFFLSETVDRILAIACENLPKFLTGEPLRNRVPHGEGSQAE